MLLFLCISFCVRKHLQQNDINIFLYFFCLFVVGVFLVFFSFVPLSLDFSEQAVYNKTVLSRGVEQPILTWNVLLHIKKMGCWGVLRNLQLENRESGSWCALQILYPCLPCSDLQYRTGTARWLQGSWSVRQGALTVPWAWVGGPVHRPVTWSTALLQGRKEYSLGQWNLISLQGALVNRNLEKAGLYHSDCLQWSTKCLHLSWSSHCRASPVGVGWLTVN